MNLYFNTNKIGYSQNSKISNKKSVKKKDVSEVLTEENIEKMRQIAYNDAIKTNTADYKKLSYCSFCETVFVFLYYKY